MLKDNTPAIFNFLNHGYVSAYGDERLIGRLYDFLAWNLVPNHQLAEKIQDETARNAKRQQNLDDFNAGKTWLPRSLDIWDYYQLPKHICHSELFAWNTDPKQELYSITIDEAVTLTAHVRTSSGVEPRIIFQKRPFKANYVIWAFKSMVKAWDKSDAFVFCPRCQQLRDSKASQLPASPVCFDCNTSQSQPFDPAHFDPITDINSIDIWAEKREGFIGLYKHEIHWYSSHESLDIKTLVKALPLSTPPEQVRQIKQQIIDSSEFYRVCGHCKTLLHVDQFFHKQTCYSCAERVYGVVY